MKSVLKLVAASFVGAILAFGAVKFFDKEVVIYESDSMPRMLNTSSPTVESALDFTKASEVAMPAVVHISAKNEEYSSYENGTRRRSLEDFFYYNPNRKKPQAGTGSGVLISEDGYIVTNNHVVGYADFIEVTLNDGRKVTAAKVGTDPSSDLAVIKIEEIRGLQPLRFGNSDNVKIGQWVVAVGNPFDLKSTVTAGIVSAKGRDLDLINKGNRNTKTIEEFIQTDAVVNPGNSGGALVDANGTLIGINTAISSPTGYYAGYSFAIPSNIVKRVVREIKENGNIQRAYLGVSIADIRRGDDSGLEPGIYVDKFLQNSSAYFAGMKVGDKIVAVNGSTVDNFDSLKDALKFAKVGDVLKVNVKREGRLKNIDVKLRKGI